MTRRELELKSGIRNVVGDHLVFVLSVTEGDLTIGIVDADERERTVTLKVGNEVEIAGDRWMLERTMQVTPPPRPPGWTGGTRVVAILKQLEKNEA